MEIVNFLRTASFYDRKVLSDNFPLTCRQRSEIYLYYIPKMIYLRFLRKECGCLI